MNEALAHDRSVPQTAAVVEPPLRTHDAGADAVKGLLITLIALGHDGPAFVALPWLTRFLYGFHVIGFLLLPFLLPAARADRRVLTDRAIRYLVPYAAFVLLSACLYTLISAREVPAATVLSRVAIALYSGSAMHLKRACGLALFWFLPTLFSLTVLRAGLHAAATIRTSGMAKAMVTIQPPLLVLALAAHATVALSPEFSTLLPLGLGPALLALPLGLAAGRLWPWARSHPAVTCVVAAAIAWASVRTGSHVNLGEMGWGDARQPLQLALQDAHAVSMFLAIAVAGPWLARVPGLARLGRLSMGVYLGHSFVLQALLIGTTRAGLEPLGRNAAMMALPFLVIAVAGGVVFALVLEREPLRRWILPRGLHDWPLTSHLAVRPGTAPAPSTLR
jgi:fucose 4-O-acetylase-like acetyltransferase